MKPGTAARRMVRYDSGPNMTPLVDVVIVLLIFLMLSGTFAGDNWFLPAASPGGGGAGPAATTARVPPLNVYIRTAGGGGGGGGGGFVAHVGDRAVGGDADALADHLNTRRLQLEAVGTPAGDVQVIIRPAAGVAYDDVARVYEAALRAKLTKVAFAPSH